MVHAINYWLREYKIIYVAKGQDWKPVLDYHYLKAVRQQGFKKEVQRPPHKEEIRNSETLPSFLRLSSDRLKRKVLLMLPSDGTRSMSAPVKAPLILNDMFRFNKNTCCHLGDKIFSQDLTCFSMCIHTYARFSTEPQKKSPDGLLDDSPHVSPTNNWHFMKWCQKML